MTKIKGVIAVIALLMVLTIAESDAQLFSDEDDDEYYYQSWEVDTTTSTTTTEAPAFHGRGFNKFLKPQVPSMKLPLGLSIGGSGKLKPNQNDQNFINGVLATAQSGVPKKKPGHRAFG